MREIIFSKEKMFFQRMQEVRVLGVGVNQTHKMDYGVGLGVFSKKEGATSASLSVYQAREIYSKRNVYSLKYPIGINE